MHAARPAVLCLWARASLALHGVRERRLERALGKRVLWCGAESRAQRTSASPSAVVAAAATGDGGGGGGGGRIVGGGGDESGAGDETVVGVGAVASDPRGGGI